MDKFLSTGNLISCSKNKDDAVTPNRKRKLDSSENSKYIAKLTPLKLKLNNSIDKGSASLDGNFIHNTNSSKDASDLSFSYSSIKCSQICFRSITAENLNLKYARIFSRAVADCIFQRLEKEVKYFSGDLVKVKVYGKWHNIPRKQNIAKHSMIGQEGIMESWTRSKNRLFPWKNMLKNLGLHHSAVHRVSYGDPGLSYRFSGTSIPAVPWNECNIIRHLKEIVESTCQESFNFVLVNRYKDGKDHMGEHRDDEKDLVRNAPIASLSFGQMRDFIFKHKDSRGNISKCTRKIDPVTLQLEHGSLLLMQSPTNQFWYHSLPVRAKAPNVRINLTFRKMVK